MSKKNNDPQPHFPFDRMPYQEKEESGEELNELEMESTLELDLGESHLRQKKRTLRDERDAGHEP